MAPHEIGGSMPVVSLEQMLLGAAAGVAMLVAWGSLFFVLEAAIPWLRARYAGDRAGDWRLQREARFLKRDFALEFCLPILNKALEVSVLTWVVYSVMSVVQPQLPNFILAEPIARLPFAVQVFCAMLVMDLSVYAEHRFVHRFAWPFHAIHHAAEEISWITAFRIHPGNALTIMLFNSGIGWVLGFPGTAWAVGLSLMGFLAMFQHANLDWSWPGPLRYLLVSPNFHKWHHVRRKEAFGKNFCLGFPFIDVLFGSFYCPVDVRPSEFGIYELPGEEPVRGGILAQLWYPFGRCLRALRAMLGGSSSQ